MNGLILYTGAEGADRIWLRNDGHSVWLTQADLAELFSITTHNIDLRFKVELPRNPR